MYMGLLPLIYHQYHLIHHKLYSLENSDKTFFTKPLRNTLEKGGILERFSITWKRAFIFYSLEIRMGDAAIAINLLISTWTKDAV